MTGVQPDIDPALFRRIDLNLFRVFDEIIRRRGISAAARQLGLQQPAVSLALKRLEAHFGTPLCTRSSTGIEPTPAGRVVAAFAEHLHQQFRALPQSIAAVAGEIEGLLTIRTVSSVVSAELDAALDAMRRRHPLISLHIDVQPQPAVLQAIIDGSAEVCLTFDSAPRADLAYEPLIREFQQLYCGRAHPLYGGRIDGPEVLAEERFVVTGYDEPDVVRFFRQRYGLGRSPAGRAENIQEATRLIKVGVGIGFLPNLTTEEALRDGQLWPLLPEAMLPNYLIYLVTKPEATQQLPAQLFLAEIRRRLAAQST